MDHLQSMAKIMIIIKTFVESIKLICLIYLIRVIIRVIQQIYIVDISHD